MRKINFIIMACMLAGLAVSCSKDVDNPIEAFPFQETEDGKWGMMTTDGKVICSEEFDNIPTVVTDGRFFAKNDDDMWVLYEASSKMNKIGGEYVYASCFYDGVALVTEKNKPVSLIDKDGKTIKLLDKIEGKVVSSVLQFQEGYAVFKTMDGFEGAIDTKGNCVVKPEYVSLFSCSDGKFLGINKKYKEDWEHSNRSKIKVSVVNTKGEEILELSASKYYDMAYGFTDGLLPVAVEKKGKKVWGIIDEKGEIVVKPSDKISGIGSISGDKFTFYNGENWGLMNTKGETLIRAKYEQLMFDCGNMLIAKNDDDESLILNEKGEKICETEDYEIYYPFSWLDGKHSIVKIDDHTFSIIDRKGKLLKDVPDMSFVNLNRGDTYIESDYVDLEALISELKISKDGLQGVTFGTKVEKVVDMIPELNKDISSYRYVGSELYFDKNISEVNCNFKIDFPESVVIRDENWDYHWNECTPNLMGVSIKHDGIMNGKLKDLYAALSGKVIGWGTVVKKNDGAAIVSLGNGKYAIVAMMPDQVATVWGDMPWAEDFDISEFANVNEHGYGDSEWVQTPAIEEPHYTDSVAEAVEEADWY